MADRLPIFRERSRRGRLALRDYRLDDVDRFVMASDFAADLALARELGLDPFRNSGLIWSLVKGPDYDEQVIGCAGVHPLGGGRWGAWACLSSLTRREWAFAMAAARAVLGDLFKGMRVQAVPSGHPGAVAVLRRIGFVEVGEPYMVWEG